MAHPQFNPLTAVIFSLRPPGFQIETRHSNDGHWTGYRFTRLSDGVWCQQTVRDVLIDQVIDIKGLAKQVLHEVERKFADGPCYGYL